MPPHGERNIKVYVVPIVGRDGNPIHVPDPRPEESPLHPVRLRTLPDSGLRTNVQDLIAYGWAQIHTLTPAYPQATVHTEDTDYFVARRDQGRSGPVVVLTQYLERQSGDKPLPEEIELHPGEVAFIGDPTDGTTFSPRRGITWEFDDGHEPELAPIPGELVGMGRR